MIRAKPTAQHLHENKGESRRRGRALPNLITVSPISCISHTACLCLCVSALQQRHRAKSHRDQLNVVARIHFTAPGTVLGCGCM